jgi:insertion element IS1 protein InsB
MNNLRCPQCGLSHIKKNGHTYYGEQNYQCLDCRRQFVAETQRVSEATKELARKLLLERLSLRGICRVLDVSLGWLLSFFVELYEQLPADLNLQLYEGRRNVQVFRLEAEADEMWSFVQRKENKQWIWIAIDTTTKQIIAFYVGDRSRQSAKQLWKRIPQVYRREATFYTDDYDPYKGVIPTAQHQVCAKGSGRTNAIERFNCTLRQRVSRLVRETLSFSKKLANHIGAIKYFICHYNLMIISSL